METKLILAKGIGGLCYIAAGCGALTLVFKLLIMPRTYQGIGPGSICLLFCIGLFFDLLSDIGWKVFLMTEPDRADSDRRT